MRSKHKLVKYQCTQCTNLVTPHRGSAHSRAVPPQQDSPPHTHTNTPTPPVGIMVTHTYVNRAGFCDFLINPSMFSSLFHQRNWKWHWQNTRTCSCPVTTLSPHQQSATRKVFTNEFNRAHAGSGTTFLYLDIENIFMPITFLIILLQ